MRLTLQKVDVYCSKLTGLYKEMEMTTVTKQKPARRKKRPEAPKPIFNRDFDSYVRAHINRNFGRPDNITSENLLWYRGWDHGGVQRGRLDVWFKVMNKDDYKDVKINSYFIKVYETTISVWSTSKVSNEPDFMFKQPSDGQKTPSRPEKGQSN